MVLQILFDAAIAIFVAGNLYRIVRAARMPAHLRWELYPVPHGPRSQQKYGGSYYENSEWWLHREKTFPGSEVLYMLEEVFLLRGVWKSHRALWPSSWLFHMGMYALVLSLFLAFTTSIAIATLSRSANLLIDGTHYLALGAFSLGSLGGLGLLGTRAISPRLRPYTSRASYINLSIITAIFGTGLAAVYFEPLAIDQMVALFSGMLHLNKFPHLPPFATAHVALLSLFLAYFPFTHMTHAYMKFFTYHQVRWDDAPTAHDATATRRIAKQLTRPVTWSAPHIGSTPATNWLHIATKGGGNDKA